MSLPLRARRRGERGAVLVETALVTGIILTMLLFGIQIGILGFLQITVDAASFVDARLAAVGVADGNSHAAATSGIFPQVSPSQIAATVAPAPSPSVPVDYGYNSLDPATLSASATHRHGGVSMMQPTLQTSTITKPNVLGLLGKNVGVASQSVDALWLECGIHSNVSNSNAGCSPAGPSTYQGSYFSAGENAPPYFVSFDLLHHCNDAQPWSTCSADSNFLALGTAEYLHASAGLQDGNWDNATAGAGGTTTGSPTSTFSVMACHQRVYSTIANYFSQFPLLTDYYNAQNTVYSGNTNAAIVFYQLWLTPPSVYGTTPTVRRGLSDFRTGPVANNPYGTIVNFNTATNNAIAFAYRWDSVVQNGASQGSAANVGSLPTYPGANCP